MTTLNIPMTTQEAMAVMKAIGTANMHPDTSKQDRMISTWVAERLEREMNTHLRDMNTLLFLKKG